MSSGIEAFVYCLLFVVLLFFSFWVFLNRVLGMGR